MEPLKMLKPPISEKWTMDDRLRAVQAMLSQIQEDVYAGRYSVTGRPNITSVQHVLAEPAAVLETYRKDIEKIVGDVEDKTKCVLWPPGSVENIERSKILPRQRVRAAWRVLTGL